MIFLTEAQTKRLLGPERFERLRRGGWIKPCLKVEGFEGEPVYPDDYVRMRLKEDRRVFPSAVPAVTKSFGGPPRPSPLLRPTGTGGHRVDAGRGTRSTSTPGVILCQQCGGSGNCPHCEGVGTQGGRPCDACGGSGECNHCDGVGTEAKLSHTQVLADLNAARKRLHVAARAFLSGRGRR
jgi:hypothetical protein